MSFKFNFPNQCQDHQSEPVPLSRLTSEVPENEDIVVCAKEVHSSSTENNLESFKVIAYTFSSVKLKVVDPKVVEQELTNGKAVQSAVAQALASNSDLIPGVYEGGLKVWECSVDLSEFISQECVEFQGKSVLELGCGAGLPGLCAMMRGASRVHFQDYNLEVLESLTVRNTNLNKMNDCICRFFSGDWSSFLDLAAKEHIVRYDVILSAETIYNCDNYSKLIKIFDSLLAPNGTVYLAAKTNYFGVGGGTHIFADFLNSKGGYTSTICHIIQANVPREIMKIERCQS